MLSAPLLSTQYVLTAGSAKHRSSLWSIAYYLS